VVVFSSIKLVKTVKMLFKETTGRSRLRKRLWKANGLCEESDLVVGAGTWCWYDDNDAFEIVEEPLLPLVDAA
jgi:hypothetical protein